MKTCNRCGTEKPLQEFYRNSEMAAGYLHQCKACTLAKQRGFVSANRPHVNALRRKNGARPEKKAQRRQQSQLRRPVVAAADNARARAWRRANLDREYAHGVFHRWVRLGRIKRADTCSACGAGGLIDGHHEDYSKPLDVVWLCRSCHLTKHRSHKEQPSV